ncbi:hypothetical protein M9Y10_033284 [Tritrichomonas musculus]|uniref:DUF3447 domain-containing protein n=1 Tax=Tritrichomonas musculus TaxID=1915356 RepID=A0ABR2KCD4_9EUKA
MSIEENLEKSQGIQKILLDYIEKEENVEEDFGNLSKKLNEKKIKDDINELKLFLHLLTKISNNHNRISNFFYKIEKIILFFEDQIKKYFSNREIFCILKIFSIDEGIFNIIIQDKYKEANYPQYFMPEIKQFVTESFIQKIVQNDLINENDWIDFVLKDLPDDFEEKRLKGENDDRLSELIQNDKLEEFITYVNQNMLAPQGQIKRSIYETNNFLNKRKSTLIEYSAFFGSIQIFKYLFLNKADVSPSLWLFAIHGNNPEMIHFFEKNKIAPPKDKYDECFIEAVKCHHNDVANYIANDLLNDFKSSLYLRKILKYFNFSFIQKKDIDVPNFIILCKYDYYSLVKILLDTKWIDINRIIVFYFINN